jgi:U4/U6 small nuclear ribonucleoprotein PRP31
LRFHHGRTELVDARITFSMATLEQELMADFADSGDEDMADLENDFGGGGSGEEMVDEEAEFAAEQGKKEKKGPADIQGAQALMKNLKPILEQIDEVKDRTPEVLDGESIEENPEYQLLTEANEFSTQIGDEVQAVHKFVRDLYSAKFPYMEELIQNPIDFTKSVLILQNSNLDDLKTIAQSADNALGVPLKNILSPPSLMVLTVEATRAKGRDLTENELEAIVGACKLLLELEKAKDTLSSFVQSRMNAFAPNLTVLLGSLAAAQLISHAGGISGLAKTPSCNIASLGVNRASGLGLASNIGVRHQGYLYHSPLLQTIREDQKKQAMRILSGKVVLAARVDLTHGDRSTGEKLKEECERRLDKLTEPPKNNGVRALPAPDDKPARKRGGRRARAQKAAVAMTDMRAMQNRMAFGKEEKEIGYGDSTKGMGMVGAKDTGRLRAQQIDPKTRAKLSKKQGAGWGGDTTLGAASSLKGFGAGGTATSLRAQGLRTGGVGLGGAGTSSIAFTPVQGLELVDPKAREEMNRKRKADEDRWFKGGSFTQLGGSSKVDAGGFKVPALPAKRPKTES